VEDWRYENLRDDIRQLRKEIREVEGRAYKFETWRMLLPIRVFIVICWIFNAGMIAFVIARAATH
jgi:hypothetical protein